MSNKLANAINLARRLTVQNENDYLVTENFAEDDGMSSMSSRRMTSSYTQQDCMELSSHLMHLKDLPVQCQKFPSVTNDLKRRDTDTTHGSEVLS